MGVIPIQDCWTELKLTGSVSGVGENNSVFLCYDTIWLM